MKKYLSVIKTGFVLTMMLLVTIIVLVLVIYTSTLKADYVNGADPAIVASAIDDVQGCAAVCLVFLAIVLAVTAYILVDVYVRENDRNYSSQLQQLVASIDQQTTPDKIEFYADRLIKFVSKTAIRQKSSLKTVYTGLQDLYLIKAMKSEEEMNKFKDYMAILIKAYAEANNMTNAYSNTKIQKIAEAAALYDIGKLAIPGYILYKETVLTKEEYDIVKKHVKYGYDLIQAIKPECALGSFEQYARDIVGYHHERYDGKGYPYGLIGDNIPFLARVASLVMTYDAVTKERPFKKAMSHEEAVLLINNEKNRQFDPKIVKAFDGVEQEFKRIKDRSKGNAVNARHRQIVDSDLVEDNKLIEDEQLIEGLVKHDEEIIDNAEEVEAPGVTTQASTPDVEAIYKEYGIEVPVKEEKKIKLNKNAANNDKPENSPAGDDDFIELDVKK